MIKEMQIDYINSCKLKVSEEEGFLLTVKIMDFENNNLFYWIIWKLLDLIS